MTTKFIDRMIMHWAARPCTPALIQGWSALERAVEDAATKKRWQVLPLPTGTGKTEALIVLLATPIGVAHPGALVVTKFKAEADRLSSAMNSSAGRPIALAAHSGTMTNPADMNASPVLVITHAAYAAALREAQDLDVPSRLDMYSVFHHNRRRWLIIDEAFDWTDQYEVDADEMGAMCGALSGALYDDAANVLNSLQTLVRSIIDGKRSGKADSVFSAEQSDLLSDVDITQARSAVQGLPKTDVEIWRNAQMRLRTKDEQPTTIKKQYLALLERLQIIQRIARCWISQRGLRTRIHASRSLLDTSLTCGVILDATAGVDTSYDLLGDSVDILARPHGMRSYRNVSVKVSRQHHVGKLRLVKSAPTDWPVIAKQIALSVKPQSKVLVLTHLDAKQYIKPCGIKCRAFEVSHWGDLDGKNDWAEFDTVVVYGLPYLDNIAPTNFFSAQVGFKSNDWFEGRHHYGQHTDIKAAIKCGFIVKSVLQGINRVRCRTISDYEGNCAPATVYLMLPAGNVGEAVLSAIRQEMPDVQMLDWQAMFKVQERLSKNEARLITLLRGNALNTCTKSEIVARLPITARTFERMSSKLQMPGSILARELAAIGVKYECAIGRGREACFTKH